ncbi:DUF4780 domain-containing protein, partial [Klebsiella pneumoniae]|uniref:DUF4780 domain-containing protein n=1 Tax=Klebsiella pneumoniae TaxID=573 RepID=UPI0040557458
MTDEQFVALKACIMKRILTSKIKVNFHNTAMKDGWALIICANKETSEWLIKETESLKPWEGAELKCLGEKEFT